MSFGWRACAQALATQMSHTPRSVPPVQKCPTIRATKIEHKLVSSQTFRVPWGYPGKNSGISRPKSLISLVSRDTPNFLTPTPSRGRPLLHRIISGLKSLGLCSFLVPEKWGPNNSESTPFCNRCVCNWNMNNQTINV